MQNNYSVTSLNSYFKKQPDVNEEQLKEIINSFSSPVNPDVERFLHRNSIMFTKKKQSISYMVSQNGHLVGYFALAIKPVTFRSEVLSNSAKKVIERVSKYDAATGEYNASGYLIAQLGKNFRLAKELQISGADLLNIAINTIQLAQNIVGGTIVFLECENHKKLLDFYELNGFRAFSSRTVGNTNTETQVLNQLYRLI